MTDLPPPQWPPPEPATPPPPPPYGGQYPPPYAPPPAQPPAYGAYYPPTPPSEAVDQPKVDGFAITSLVFGILGGLLFSVGFGIAALVRIGKGKRRGKGLAIAGLGLSGAWIVAFVLIYTFSTASARPPYRDANSVVTKAGHLAPMKLRNGDCVRLPGDLSDQLTSINVVPCDQPHNAEAFSHVPASDRDFYPGENAVQAGSLDRCGAAADSYLGAGGTGLTVIALYPDSVQWDTETKLSTCLLVDEDADFTGSIRDHAA